MEVQQTNDNDAKRVLNALKFIHLRWATRMQSISAGERSGARHFYQDSMAI